MLNCLLVELVQSVDHIGIEPLSEAVNDAQDHDKEDSSDVRELIDGTISNVVRVEVFFDRLGLLVNGDGATERNKTDRDTVHAPYKLLFQHARSQTGSNDNAEA